MIREIQCQAVVTCRFGSCWRMSELMTLPGRDVDGNNDSPVLAKAPLPQKLLVLWWHHVVTTRQAGSFLKHLMSCKARENDLCRLTYCCQCRWMESGSGINAYFSPLFDSGNLWLYWHSLAVNLSSCMWMSLFNLTPDFNCGSVSQAGQGEKHISHS